MVDGSNESLYYANEESDLNLWTGVPLQKSFEKVDVMGLQKVCDLVTLFFVWTRAPVILVNTHAVTSLFFSL